tara:strand:+ start:15121 stop:15696 length:576 start_codon:yes stop_codon:yes gene_type:complete
MKPLRYLFLIILFVSCEKYEPELKNHYPYDPQQNLVMDVEVIPVGDVLMEFEDMQIEVNADYFNRYGIGVNLLLKEGIPYPVEGESLLKYELKKIMVYVVPMEYIKMSGVAAYTVRWSNNDGVRANIILGEDFQTNRTLAHELGHAFGLNHVRLKNNVMTIGVSNAQYWTPNDFVEKQIDTITSNFDWYSN